MKTRVIAWALTLAVLVGRSAVGQVTNSFLFRNRSPIVNDTLRCDLTPLYVWWAEQLVLNTQLSATGSTNAVEEVTNQTDKPMAPWVHITGGIAREDPQGWIVSGTVEFAPGKGNPASILLIHPPRKELERFAVRSNLLSNPLPVPDYSSREDDIKAIKNRAFVANSIGDEYLEDVYLSQATQAQRELVAQKERDQSMAAERKRALDELGDFPPDWRTYRADIFALNTGRQLYGLPVFDAGLSFVK